MDRLIVGDRIAVIGGTGSLGTTLVARLLEEDVDVIVFSRDEGKQWLLRQKHSQAVESGRLVCVVGDVRDRNAVDRLIRDFRPQNIIVASALKQVDTCEAQPSESILTNVTGVQNVVDAVDAAHALGGAAINILFVSTDKACSPVNVYGMCKALAEKIVTSPQPRLLRPQARRAVVRYGNVLDSRGSIIPLFRLQAASAPEFTLTHADMTRFLMTLDDSVDLIMDALASAVHGETWIPQLKSMKIDDLAEIYSRRYGKPVRVVGVRPGEKIHEVLINDIEMQRVRMVVGRSGNNRFVISPKGSGSFEGSHQYTSADDTMSYDALESYLDELGMI